MALVRGYINIYRSGFFHKPGKPGAYDRHGGDVYHSYDQAILAIDPPSHYIGTAEITWNEAEHPNHNPDCDPFAIPASKQEK